MVKNYFIKYFFVGKVEVNHLYQYVLRIVVFKKVFYVGGDRVHLGYL